MRVRSIHPPGRPEQCVGVHDIIYRSGHLFLAFQGKDFGGVKLVSVVAAVKSKGQRYAGREQDFVV